MSSDSFVVVRQFPDGWRWADGCASTDWFTLSDDRFRSEAFTDPWDAKAAAESDLPLIEYGVEIERPRYGLSIEPET